AAAGLGAAGGRAAIAVGDVAIVALLAGIQVAVAARGRRDEAAGGVAGVAGRAVAGAVVALLAAGDAAVAAGLAAAGGRAAIAVAGVGIVALLPGIGVTP